MSTKPGQTWRPAHVDRARGLVGAISPTAAIRSPWTATSAGKAGAPVPSTTVPPRKTTSKAGAASTRPGRQADNATRAVPPSVRKRRRVFRPMVSPWILFRLALPELLSRLDPRHGAVPRRSATRGRDGRRTTCPRRAGSRRSGRAERPVGSGLAAALPTGRPESQVPRVVDQVSREAIARRASLGARAGRRRPIPLGVTAGGGAGSTSATP